MFKIQAPILIVPVAEAGLVLGVHLHAAGLAAYREIAVAAKGLEIAHLQFVFRGWTLAVCSRVRRDGIVEIEMGLGDPRLPKSFFTTAQMRQPRPPLGRGVAQGIAADRRAYINLLSETPCGASADSGSRGATAFSRMRVDVAVAG